MTGSPADKRKDERYDYPAAITYSLHSDSSEEIFRGVTINLSKSGVCMYLFRLPEEQQKIKIKSNLPVAAGIAEIRWIKKIEEDFYQVGMAFV
ncbi:PilZ domain protein [bacterium BMS3Bbin05]|nr:PilZ domain protein [bacterium BMS3Bbin05]HDO22604.1 PilZ domain-containing protein [Nitrospirota bacterium]HDZ88907.1 PilZ domain-containing protein [Nitrospirota bacterium]